MEIKIMKTSLFLFAMNMFRSVQDLRDAVIKHKEHLKAVHARHDVKSREYQMAWARLDMAEAELRLAQTPPGSAEHTRAEKQLDEATADWNRLRSNPN